ncbi:MAG TPA: hypothetical protein PKA88_02545 [Polyangiaceae bacterium]|nr:hypothetical protein [Polyangiaceae bacterium]
MTLLSLNQLRIDDPGGQVLTSGWELAAGERSLALVGDFTPLSQLLSGQATLAAGSALILGQPARAEVQAGRVGLLIPDLALPRTWTVSAYLEAGGHLLGGAPRQVRALATSTLQHLGLPHLGTRRIETLTLLEIRFAQLAQALLSNPGTLYLHDPFAGLSDGEATEFDARLLHASTDKQVILSSVSLPFAGNARAALERADTAAVLLGGRLYAGAPSEILNHTSGTAVTVARNASAFAARLGDAGVATRPDPSQLSDQGPCTLFAEGKDADLVPTLVEAALGADAPMLELLPTQLAAATDA